MRWLIFLYSFCFKFGQNVLGFLHQSIVWSGKTLRIEAVDQPFSFSALPYSAQYLASKTHDYALKEEEGKTFLNINCAVMGLGNSSCGPGVLKKYAIDPNKKHQLRIRILD